jgi:hypothetical protein
MFQQLKNCPDDNLIIKTVWPSRIADTFVTLGKLKTTIDSALNDRTDVAPVAFEIILTRDLAARYKGAQTFVQDGQAVLLEFYTKIGQHLREWVASPPKLTISEPSKVIDGTIESQPEIMAEEHAAVHADLPPSIPLPLAVNE